MEAIVALIPNHPASLLFFGGGGGLQASRPFAPRSPDGRSGEDASGTGCPGHYTAPRAKTTPTVSNCAIDRPVRAVSLSRPGLEQGPPRPIKFIYFGNALIWTHLTAPK